MGARIDARAKFGEDDDAEDEVEPFDPGLAWNERRDDDEQNGDNVERDKRKTEAMRGEAPTVIEQPQPLAKGRGFLLRLFLLLGGRRRLLRCG